MFEEMQKKEDRLEVMTPVKCIAFSAAMSGVGLGMCGLGAVVHGPERMWPVALVLFGVGVMGMVLGTLWLVVVVVVNGFRQLGQ